MYPLLDYSLTVRQKMLGRRLDGGGRVARSGQCFVLENRGFSEWVAREEEHLCLIPDNLCGAPAAGLTVAYNALTEERQLLLFSDEFA